MQTSLAKASVVVKGKAKDGESARRPQVLLIDVDKYVLDTAVFGTPMAALTFTNIVLSDCFGAAYSP